MNIVPAFLQRGKEPVPPPLPRVPQEKRRQLAMDFMDDVDRQREECAYLRTENDQLRVENKVLREQVRLLQDELNFVRDQLDRVGTHDKLMLGGLGAIKAAIIDLEQRSRAEAYAPPGSGNAQTEAAIDNAAAELAKQLAPEGKPDA